MTQQNLLEQAKQGNVQAINVLLNRVFQLNGITAKTTIQNRCLHLLLESAQVPNQQTLVPAIRGAMLNLGVESIDEIAIYGRQIGMQKPAWSQQIQLSLPEYPAKSSLEPTPSSVPGPLESKPSPLSSTDVPLTDVPLTNDETASALTSSLDGPSSPSSSIWQALPPKEHLEESTFRSAETPNSLEINGAIASFSSLDPSDGDAQVTSPALASPVVLPDSNGPMSEEGTVLPGELVDDLDDPHSLEGESTALTQTGFREMEVRPSPRLPNQMGRNIFLVGLAALILGILWLHNSVVSKQRLAVERALVLAGSVKPVSKATSVGDLKIGVKKLQESTQLLEAVPPSSGAVHLQAQQELKGLYPRIDAMEKQIAREEEAEANLQTAQELVAQSTQMLKTSSQSSKAARQAEVKLQQAIKLLAAIKPDTFVYETARQKLIAYQALYEKATNQINSSRKQAVPQKTEKRSPSSKVKSGKG